MRDSVHQEAIFRFPDGNAILIWHEGLHDRQGYEVELEFHAFDAEPEQMLHYSFGYEPWSHDVWLGWAYHLRDLLLRTQGDPQQFDYFLEDMLVIHCEYMLLSPQTKDDAAAVAEHLSDLPLIRQILQ